MRSVRERWVQQQHNVLGSRSRYLCQCPSWMSVESGDGMDSPIKVEAEGREGGTEVEDCAFVQCGYSVKGKEEECTYYCVYEEPNQVWR